MVFHFLQSNFSCLCVGMGQQLALTELNTINTSRGPNSGSGLRLSTKVETNVKISILFLWGTLSLNSIEPTFTFNSLHLFNACNSPQEAQIGAKVHITLLGSTKTKSAGNEKPKWPQRSQHFPLFNQKSQKELDTQWSLDPWCFHG
jgi:hypothetical protein